MKFTVEQLQLGGKTLWNPELHVVLLLSICVPTVVVKKFAVGTLAVRSRVSARGAAENCHTGGCKTE